ncbi:MAG TPA: hypothetical protein VFQ95_00275 [Rhodanobacteraceae bacterium]|nr:hypothetical protein [Rhodanobacteraceae bacterium]
MSDSTHHHKFLYLRSTTLAAWALVVVGVPDRGVRIGLAAAVAAAVGMLASRHGSGRDSARLVTLIFAMLIPLYAALRAVFAGGAGAMAVACLAVAVAALTASLGNVWPDGYERKFTAAAGIALCAAAANLLVLIVAHV